MSAYQNLLSDLGVVWRNRHLSNSQTSWFARSVWGLSYAKPVNPLGKTSDSLSDFLQKLIPKPEVMAGTMALWNLPLLRLVLTMCAHLRDHPYGSRDLPVARPSIKRMVLPLQPLPTANSSVRGVSSPVCTEFCLAGFYAGLVQPARFLSFWFMGYLEIMNIAD